MWHLGSPKQVLVSVTSARWPSLYCAFPTTMGPQDLGLYWLLILRVFSTKPHYLLRASKWRSRDLNPHSGTLKFTCFIVILCWLASLVSFLLPPLFKPALFLPTSCISLAWGTNGDWTPSSWNSASTENILSGKQMAQTSSLEREGNVFFKTTVLFSFVLFPAGIQKWALSSSGLQEIFSIPKLSIGFWFIMCVLCRLSQNKKRAQLNIMEAPDLCRHYWGASACLLWGVSSQPEKKKIR